MDHLGLKDELQKKEKRIKTLEEIVKNLEKYKPVNVGEVLLDEKDKKIKGLENKLETINEELKKYKDQTKKLLNIKESQEDTKEEISSLEKQQVNSLIKSYLKEQNYRITYINFDDENTEEEFYFGDNITILTVFRNFIAEKEQKESKKDQEALRNALNYIEEKEAQIKNFERKFLKMERIIIEKNNEIKLLNENENNQMNKINEINEKNNETNESITTEEEEIDKLSIKILDLLGSNLPIIIKQIKSVGRETVIPLLLIIIEKHVDSSIRIKMSNEFLNLIKKPDEEQRKTLIENLIKLMRLISSDILENEVLPFYFEFVQNVLPEKRLLFIEISGIHQKNKI
jgi:hypothetical protein